jgi:molybdopterin-binding protein
LEAAAVEDIQLEAVVEAEAMLKATHIFQQLSE